MFEHPGDCGVTYLHPDYLTQELAPLGRITSGRFLRLAYSSSLAPSFSLGLEPGRFFGASDLPSSVAAT